MSWSCVTYLKTDGSGNGRYEQIVQPPCRTIESLINTPLANAEFLHVSPPFSPEDLFKLQSGLRQGGDGGWRPKIVFEPTPGSCHPGQQEWLEKIAPGVEVLSYASLDIAGSGVDKFRPNHEELLSFYSCEQYPLCSPEFRPTLERLTHRLLDKMAAGGNEGGIIAVRCGRMGSSVGTRSGGVKWFPACFGAEDERLVKDVTGGEYMTLGQSRI